jgi:hypothetical protein
MRGLWACTRAAAKCKSAFIFRGSGIDGGAKCKSALILQQIPRGWRSQREIDALLQDQRLVGEVSSIITAFLQDRSLAEWIMWRRIEVSISY